MTLPAAFGKPSIFLLAAFGNYFMNALAVFNKINRKN
jgi:hypothetical protein